MERGRRISPRGATVKFYRSPCEPTRSYNQRNINGFAFMWESRPAIRETNVRLKFAR